MTMWRATESAEEDVSDLPGIDPQRDTSAALLYGETGRFSIDKQLMVVDAKRSRVLLIFPVAYESLLSELADRLNRTVTPRRNMS
jgi:hypothetical protein